MALLDDLKWRYATKKMNGKTIPQEKLEYIVEAARFAPSSSGLQPYRIIVVSDRELLTQMKAFSFNQSQLTDCSHLLIWAAWDGYTPERVGDVLLGIARERGTENDNTAPTTSEEYKNFLLGYFNERGYEWQKHHAAKQAYISFGMAIAAAAEQKVDATPMEGFDAAKMDQLLQLDQFGLKSVVLLPLGYRDDTNDWLLNLKKVRTPKDEFRTVLA